MDFLTKDDGDSSAFNGASCNILAAINKYAS